MKTKLTLFILSLTILLLTLIPNVTDAQDACGIATPPNVPIRSIAEWEEMEAIVVAWNSIDRQLLADIIGHAKKECEVIVLASNETLAESQLLNQYGLEDLDNVRIVQASFNTIWIRDYGANPVYLNNVDSLVFVDWIYNRPRPQDDDVYCTLAEVLDIPLYQTVTQPTDLVHTGGNYMTDGLGIGFSSELVLEENDATNDYGTSNHSEEDIKELMYDYLGIEDYVLMETLPYDGIHHIDMHMKLLDEETLLVGAYPQGISDGPQIEANLAYIQQNYKTTYGTDFEIVRIDMPADLEGNYPGDDYGDGNYHTYANALFVNKTVLVPIYMDEEEDEKALSIWREALPGYNIIGLDCRKIINYSGAIHCITKEIGVADPLWITHQKIRDIENNSTEDYAITARIEHRSGIEKATLHYRTSENPSYVAIDMTDTGSANEWTASIPNQANGLVVQYYIAATANSGKQSVRPLPAPEGYYEFMIDYITSIEPIQETGHTIGDVFPNPAGALTYLEVHTDKPTMAEIHLLDALGRQVKAIHKGQLELGTYKYFFDVSKLEAGIYFVQIEMEGKREVRKFVVK